MSKILVIDDDESLCEAIEHWLAAEHHSIERAHTLEDGRQLLDTYAYDVLVLDWRLPDGAGVDLCKQLRAKGVHMPILILTGKNSIDEKEIGFEAGADDYLTKPFELRELSSRLKALTRRPQALKETVFTAGDVSMNTLTREVTKGGKPIKLYPKEYSLLEFFLRTPNVVFSTEAIIQNIWKNEDAIGPEALRTVLSRLRKEIDSDKSGSLIESVHGVGYRLRLPVDVKTDNRYPSAPRETNS